MRALSIILVATSALGVLAPHDCLAQRRAPAFATWSAPAPFVAPAAPLAFGHPDDYRWEGMAVGAVIVGAFGAYFVYGLCEQNDTGSGRCGGSLIGGALLGAAVGAVTGGLIGGMIPRAPPAPPAP